MLQEKIDKIEQEQKESEKEREREWLQQNRN